MTGENVWTCHQIISHHLDKRGKASQHYIDNAHLSNDDWARHPRQEKKRKKRGGCIAPHYKRRAPFFPLRPPPPSSFFPHTSMGFSLVPITTTSADTQEEEEGKKKVTRGARRLGASTWAARPLQQKTGIVIYLYIYIYISAWCVCDAASRNNLCSYWPASAWAKRGSRKSPTEKTCCNQSCFGGGLALPISCGGDY